GGFGTLDEVFEVLTLVQTGKLRKRLPIVLYGSAFWDSVLNLEALVEFGTISAKDLELFHRADSVDDAFAFITRELTENALSIPGGRW
ncbi:MAG: LOG family protein, partial [Rhodospirillales bacterium]|nr:LOG family protein [Rhodospirillales bacterium]